MFEMVNFISSTIKESFIHSYICLRTYGWDTCYHPMLAVLAGCKFNYLDLLCLLNFGNEEFFMGSNNSLVIRFRKFLFFLRVALVILHLFSFQQLFSEVFFCVAPQRRQT